MAQHDMNIANQGFPATRADLNNALQALVSNSSGTSAPSTTFANQWWYDTTNNKMYIRNEANNAWIEVFTLDQTNNEWQLTTGVVQAKDSDGLALNTDDGTTRLFIKDSDGAIGIGTTSPTGGLHVDKSVASAPIATFHNTSGNSSADAGIEVETSTTATYIQRWVNAGSEKARITGSGTACFQTTVATPGSGAIQASPLNGVALGTNGTATYYAGAFYYNGSLAGGISTASGGTTFLTTSDKRLKDNIKPISNGTEKIMAMNPVSHTWKTSPDDDAVHGFIAQEMQDIAPEAVTGDPNSDEMMSMDYGRITPLIVAALQEANAKIEVLEKRIQQLEAK